MSNPRTEPVMVTVSDPDTGETLEERLLENDWLLLEHGSAYLDSVQRYGNGTAVLTIKKRPQSPGPRAGKGE